MSEWEPAKFSKLRELGKILEMVAAREAETAKKKIEKLVELARIKHELATSNSKGTHPSGRG